MQPFLDSSMPGSVKGSLNFINRRKEQEKQIDQNILMLKKIHFAKPSINLTEFRRHELKQNRLKKLVSEGTQRLGLAQAARDLILSKELRSNLR